MGRKGGLCQERRPQSKLGVVERSVWSIVSLRQGWETDRGADVGRTSTYRVGSVPKNPEVNSRNLMKVTSKTCESGNERDTLLAHSFLLGSPSGSGTVSSSPRKHGRCPLGARHSPRQTHPMASGRPPETNRGRLTTEVAGDRRRREGGPQDPASHPRPVRHRKRSVGGGRRLTPRNYAPEPSLWRFRWNDRGRTGRLDNHFSPVKDNEVSDLPLTVPTDRPTVGNK